MKLKQDYKNRIAGILFYLSTLVIIAGAILLIPFILGIFLRKSIFSLKLYKAFLIPGVITICVGFLGKKIFYSKNPPLLKDSMFICTISWIIFSLIGAIPYIIILNIPYLNAVFETMSGFTTTGITLLTGVNKMPRAILFWRAFTQWIGGLGILSMFIVLGFKGGAAVNKLFQSEAHKISTRKPHPGIFNTVKTLWLIYFGLSLSEILILITLNIDLFDAITHTFTTVSTGGYSIYDASISHYRQIGHSNFNFIELTYMFFMLVGGINFFVHYNTIKGNLKSFWENIEVRNFLKIIGISIVLISASLIISKGTTYKLGNTTLTGITAVLYKIKDTAFQVISILTTTGYTTNSINSAFFTAFAKQFFLIFMVIGGCSGSTGGGVKVIRIVTLFKMIKTRIFKINTSYLARVPLTIKNKIVENEEIRRIIVIFFSWLLLLFVGGGITSFFSHLSAWQSFSGMFSVLGNIGPCYISVNEMINLHPVIKITYIIGMMAGRLEIIPVIIIFSKKFFK